MTKEKITRSELKEKRTANRKVFENQDHSRTVEIWSGRLLDLSQSGCGKSRDSSCE